MKRKIVEQGLSKTKVISLPIKWARKYGLEKGDEVTLEEAGPKLVLSTPKTTGFKTKISLQYSALHPYAHRILAKLYIAGYDHIEILNITDKKALEASKREIEQSLLGLEVIEESKEKVVFEAVIAETEEQFKTYEQKVFQTALQYAKAVRQAIEKADYTNKDIENLETANNKFSCYCERYLNKKGTKNYAFTYLIIWSMEKITDEYKYLLKHAQKHKTKASKELLAYYDKTIQFLENMHKLYNQFNMELLSTTIKQKEQLTNTGEDLLKKETTLAHHLLNVVSVSFDLLGNITARAHS
ncbi:MAG: AbrB/MazE/SpoVT family DNA-binding domain-containing protein [Candidatus Woesearchaeota archaeon]|nr:AbrB/MazE/SpoVT family DNA-binding domain-containing protein [Candidatus Woesearchaeota archaeon]